MQALMKYWNDPKTLAAIGERMGDVSSVAAPAPGPASAAAAAPAPEINNLLDAAKCAAAHPGQCTLQALPGAASAQNMQGVAQKRIGWF